MASSVLLTLPHLRAGAPSGSPTADTPPHTPSFLTPLWEVHQGVPDPSWWGAACGWPAEASIDPGLGDLGWGGCSTVAVGGNGSSPGAQLWHLSRSDSDSGTSRLGPLAPLASLFLCSGAAATPPSLLLSLPPLAYLPHTSTGRACGLGAFVFQFLPSSGQAG
jgi:hypothetical protein